MTDTLVRPASVPAVIAVLLAVLGALAMGWSFVNGVNAALDSGGSGATPYVVTFLVAAAAVLVAIVLGIVGLVRGRSRVLSVIAIVIGLVPVVGVIVLRIAAIS
jgi:hypothetical protein